jgi:hypothetical protein
MSLLMKDFYKQIAVHLGGGPTPNWFNPNQGLCRNLIRYMAIHKPSAIDSSQIKLKEEFEREGLDATYPFSNGSEQYEKESRHNTMYKNPERREWIFYHAK